MAEQVAFLFDMDGTIADTMPFHIQAWMSLLGELGVQMGPEEFLRKTSGKMNHQILREVLGIPISDADLAAFDERKESLFRTLCGPHLKPIGGLMEFLADSRRQGILMAVATAAGKAKAREFQGHPAVIRIAADYTSLRPQDLLRMARPPKPA